MPSTDVLHVDPVYARGKVLDFLRENSIDLNCIRIDEVRHSVFGIHIGYPDHESVRFLLCVDTNDGDAYIANTIFEDVRVGFVVGCWHIRYPSNGVGVGMYEHSIGLHGPHTLEDALCIARFNRLHKKTLEPLVANLWEKATQTCKP